MSTVTSPAAAVTVTGRPPSILQQLVQDHREALRATPDQHRVLRCIARCRTPAAGTHSWHCLACDHRLIAANSCGNRHCPLCQAGRRRAWVRDRENELLPIPYFHVVLSLPSELRPMARAAPRVVYDLLLRCSRQAIDDLTRDPRHLGAQVGQVQVLHTWGSDLRLHPHVHSIVTGGGMDEHGRWITVRYRRKNKRPFLVPVRALAARFRTLLLAGLDSARTAGAFAEVDLPELATPLWRALLRALRRTNWNAYAKRPFADPQRVIRYLGRYTHRIAVTDARLTAYTGATIGLRWTDYAHGGQRRISTLTAQQFLQRFTQHVLPPGLRRIRMAGLLGPRVRATRLAQARAQLPTRPPPPTQPTPPATAGGPPSAPPTTDALPTGVRRCPCCGAACMVVAWIVRPRAGGGTVTIVPERYQRERPARAVIA